MTKLAPEIELVTFIVDHVLCPIPGEADGRSSIYYSPNRPNDYFDFSRAQVPISNGPKSFNLCQVLWLTNSIQIKLAKKISHQSIIFLSFFSFFFYLIIEFTYQTKLIMGASNCPSRTDSKNSESSLSKSYIC